MKATLLLLLAASAVACASTAPKPAASADDSATDTAAGATAKQAADNPARPLTSDECHDLGQWIGEVCQNRGNTRSAQIDGWCSDMIRGVATGSWELGDCAKNVKYMDSVCFRSSKSVRTLMDCDNAVQRP
jgi:hypothetical protein